MTDQSHGVYEKVTIFEARDGILKADLEYPVHRAAWPDEAIVRA